MKKTLIFLLIFWGTTYTILAQNPNFDNPNENLGTPSEICTITSEPCSIWATQSSLWGSGQLARYKCCVSAQSGFVDLIASIYKYVFFISLVLGVLFMVVLGIGISISGFDEGGIKAKAKTQLVATIIGIIALALIPWILKTIAPFIFV